MTTSNEWNNLPTDQLNIIKNHQVEFPIKVGAVAKQLGLVVKKATLSAGISGEIKEEGNTVVVRVNRHDVKERQRFTLAHEIAHFLLHRDEIGDGITDDILYRSSLSDAKEAQANRLAADIIMPWELIEKSLKLLQGNKIEEKIEAVAREAQVSTTAMKIRFGKV